MIYVFDTSSLRVAGHYFPDHFPSFWRRLDQLVENGRVISVREVYNEVEKQARQEHLLEWVKENKRIFKTPNNEEADFVSQIFSLQHFRNLVTQRQRLTGNPVADPFVIAAAHARDGCVVTEESHKPNAARIPNVCEHFEIECTNLEGFLGRQSWQF